jgi:hypothetical protein
MKRKSKLQDTRCIEALDGRRDHPGKVTIRDALADCVDFENLYHSDRPDVLCMLSRESDQRGVVSDKPRKQPRNATLQRSQMCHLR